MIGCPHPPKKGTEIIRENAFEQKKKRPRLKLTRVNAKSAFEELGPARFCEILHRVSHNNNCDVIDEN